MSMNSEELVECLRAVKFDIEKVNSLLLAYEKAYMDIDVVPEERSRYESSVYALYAIWDAVRRISDGLTSCV